MSYLTSHLLLCYQDFSQPLHLLFELIPTILHYHFLLLAAVQLMCPPPPLPPCNSHKIFLKLITMCRKVLNHLLANPKCDEADIKAIMTEEKEEKKKG